LLGVENQCGFAASCDVSNPSGLELIISANSTQVRPNGAIAINVTEFNTRSVSNNISAAAGWTLNGLWWACGLYYYPDGIALFRGYYTLNNLTAASPIFFWAPIGCFVPQIYNGTRVAGILSNVTAYTFQPKSDVASYSAFYHACIDPDCNFRNSSLTFGTFPPVSMLDGAIIHASNSNVEPHFMNSLLSTAPSVYTLVAGDEWGDLVLLHFRVTSS
jgi:hypothetical protein